MVDFETVKGTEVKFGELKNFIGENLQKRSETDEKVFGYVTEMLDETAGQYPADGEDYLKAKRAVEVNLQKLAGKLSEDPHNVTTEDQVKLAEKLEGLEDDINNYMDENNISEHNVVLHTVEDYVEMRTN